MPFRILETVRRKSNLSTSRISFLLQNHAAFEALLKREHKSGGQHNALRIIRGVALVHCAAGTYSLAGNSSGISSVAKNGTGDVTLTLDGIYFDQTPIIVQASSMAAGATGPVIINHKIVSDTSVRLFQSRGATWAAADLSFCVGLNAFPIEVAPPPAATPALRVGVGLDATTYNGIAERIGQERAALLLEHTAAGLHNSRDIMKAWDHVAWDGGTTYAGISGFASSYTRSSAGVIDITLPAATYLNNPNPSVQIFTNPYTADGTQRASLAEEASLTNTGNYLTSFRVHLWKRTSVNTWALTDGHFRWRLHAA